MKIKKIFFLFIGIALLVTAAVLVLNVVAEQKINTFFNKRIESGKLVHGNIDVGIVSGNVEIDSLTYVSPNLKLEMGTVKFKDVHFWDLLMNNKIVINGIYLDSPKIKRTKTKKDTANEAPDGKMEFDQRIFVHSLEIENGTYIFLGAGEKDSSLYVSNISGKIDSIKINKTTLSQKIPFGHGTFSFTADSLYFDMDKYHELSIGDVLISTTDVALQDLFLRPKYSRSEFRKIVPYEKDMYHLKIGSFKIKNPLFRFNAENPVLKSPLLSIRNMKFKIYRDKTLPDDPRTKKMYSEMLRDLNLKLGIDKAKLQDVFIQYQERIKKDRPPGMVAFYDLNASIENLTNIHLNSENFPTTKLDIHTKFMNTSDLDVHWQFDVSNNMEHFTISGAVKNVPPKAMNSFFVPAMHVKANGNIDVLYFNFEGNQRDAIGDMKMKYSDFSVTVLEEKGEETNAVLSFLANLFIKSNPKNGTVEVHDVQVKRDPTKSFWNYFWSCIEKGLKKSIL